MPSLHPDALRAFVAAVCEGVGSTPTEAQLVADNLVGANLAGHDSHGVGMLPLYIDAAVAGDLAVNQQVTVVSDGGATLVLDGNAGFGAAIGTQAMNLATDRVRSTGVVAMGLRNSFHIGRIGHWAELVTASGFASIHFVNVNAYDAIVAPYGGAEARFSTNPFTVGIPGPDGPAMVLDMATSIIARGKARVAHNEGRPVADGTLLDVDGNVTTDPEGMIVRREGALVAMGEHKGSGLAIVCELLAAALTGGPTHQLGNPRPSAVLNNMLTIVIDPEAMGGTSYLFDETAAFLDYVRSSRPRPGFDRVRVPGEPEGENRVARSKGIDVDPATVEELRAAATTAGVSSAADLLEG